MQSKKTNASQHSSERGGSVKQPTSPLSMLLSASCTIILTFFISFVLTHTVNFSTPHYDRFTSGLIGYRFPTIPLNYPSAINHSALSFTTVISGSSFFADRWITSTQFLESQSAAPGAMKCGELRNGHSILLIRGSEIYDQSICNSSSQVTRTNLRTGFIPTSFRNMNLTSNQKMDCFQGILLKLFTEQLSTTRKISLRIISRDLRQVSTQNSTNASLNVNGSLLFREKCFISSTGKSISLSVNSNMIGIFLCSSLATSTSIRCAGLSGNGIKKNYGASIRSWSRATQIRKHAAGNSRIDIFRTLKTSDMSFGSAMQADGVEAQSHRIPIMILSRTISERTESGLSSKLISLIHQCAIVPMPSMQDSKTAMGFPIYSSTNINARMLFSVSRDVPISPGPLRRMIQKTGIRNQESRLTSATRSDILFTNCSPCVKRQPGVNNHA